MENKVTEIISLVLNNSGETAPDNILPTHLLRNDLGLDSLMLAELTVHIEEEFGVDIFEDGIITTVGEIYQKIESASN